MSSEDNIHRVNEQLALKDSKKYSLEVFYGFVIFMEDWIKKTLTFTTLVKNAKKADLLTEIDYLIAVNDSMKTSTDETTLKTYQIFNEILKSRRKHAATL